MRKMKSIKSIKFLLPMLFAFVFGLGNVAFAQNWTDVTSNITNPSFESDEGSSDLTSNSTDVTGWTKTQNTPGNSQWGVAKSQCKIQGIAESMPTSDGGNYYYVRCNWNNDVNYGISQEVAELPSGMYKLTYKAATSSSNWNATKHTVSLIESNGQTSTKTLYSTGASWTDFETYIYKASDESTLTIKVNMLPGSSGGSQHYVLLVDDFKLYYCEDLGATPSSEVDLTGFISNSKVNNTNTDYVPRGWLSDGKQTGNSHFTEKTGDTQLEAWSGGNMKFDYYQTLNGLPNGLYTLSAYCHDSNQKGGVLYVTAGNDTKNVGMTADYSEITTDKISVTDGTLRIGVKSELTSGGSWMTGDDFELKYYGFDPEEELATETEYEALATAIEAHILGFEAGEYAPYNNVAAAKALAVAKAINPKAKNSKAAVEEATDALANATWTANPEELNAVYDGSFNLTKETDGTYILPIGWTNLGYNTRVYNETNMEGNTGIKATLQHATLFAKYTTEYGTKEGYTMPLKAGVYYLSFIYGGWGNTATRTIKVYNSSNSATVTPSDLRCKDNNANKEVDSWSTYLGLIEIPADGDYILSFDNGTEGQDQICISDIELKKAASATMSVSATAQYGTFIAPFDVTVPEGVKAYSCYVINDNTLDLAELVEPAIPANTPVILYAENGYETNTFYGVSTATEDAYANGYLTGVYADTKAPAGSYVLQNGGNGVKFYVVEEGKEPTVKANRCYLNLPEGSDVKAFGFSFGEVDAINSINADKKQMDGAIYNLNGQRLNSLQKGLNIVNGKKLYVK